MATSSTESTFSMESLVGPKLLTKVGSPLKETKKIMDGKEIVLLYFSASWCPVSFYIVDFFCMCFALFLVDHLEPN